MNEVTTIYLTRHGQTEWNIQHRFQGHNDSPLTELGIQQAKWLGESLINDRIDVIFSSSSPRAVRTAEIIADEREIQIHTNDELKEISLGIWEGITQEEAKSGDPLQYNNFWDDPEAFNVQDSERFSDVSSRSINLLHDIIKEYSGKSILVVTHTVVVKLIMAYFENRALNNLWKPPYIHPTCLSKIEIHKDKHSIILHGDVTHLKDELIES
ncbi:histidine phosphatase family protein [Paenibacillus sp. YIM B09110]|uniref:histidine phosphatase family protein n=1 Tax=Paenibacillus sp. YIM B09110 TaxID=3126102 RepID=UPI00301D716D